MEGIPSPQVDWKNSRFWLFVRSATWSVLGLVALAKISILSSDNKLQDELDVSWIQVV